MFFQSGSAAVGGNSASTRSSTRSARAISWSISPPISGAVIGVDRHVIVREIARPHGGARAAATEIDAYGDLGFFHDPLSVFFTIRCRPSAPCDDMQIIQPEGNARRIEIRDARVADRGYDASQIRIGGKKSGLHQWRMRNRECDAAAFRFVAAAFDADRDELRRALAIAHDRMREL